MAKKVLCINDVWVSTQKVKHNPKPYCGQELEIFKEHFLPDNGTRVPGIYFEFAEFSDVFHAKNFAILPDESADEMSENEREAIVNIEKNVL